jgi:tRNA threonylcarbamoyladenosine biosynthesis protein TsaB
MLVLGITTSTPLGSVAVVRGAEVLSEQGYEGAKLHAERLFGTIDAAMVEAGVLAAGVELVACDCGPGSFTGVRVAVSAAKGMAMGLGCPLVAIGSLEAMAHQVATELELPDEDIVVPVLDAQKGEVFAAAYRAGGGVVASPWHVALGDLHRSLAPFAGAVVCGDLAAEAITRGPDGVRVGPALRGPRARFVVSAALRSLASGVASGDPRLAEPVYVRPPDAKLPAR